jgi:hypothetical protein
MNTVLSLTPGERADLFRGAAQKLGLASEVAIEKDFWVCWILRKLFGEIPAFGPHLVFKGGTSLSKVYRAINRFSEDVDITLGRELLGLDSDEHDPEKAPNPTQKKKRIEALSSKCSQWVEGDLKTQLTAKTEAELGPGGWSYEMDATDKTRLTLLFKYPSVLPAPTGNPYLTRAVLVECGAKADVWPVNEAPIKPYVAEVYAAGIKDPPVTVRALAIERSFWEKATILHAEAYRPADKADMRKNFSRHYADTVALADHAGAKNALRDADLRQRVVNFKEAFFRNSWSNYDSAKPGTFKLLPAPAHAPALEADYGRMQREMYFGTPMAWSDVILRLRELESQINTPASN